MVERTIKETARTYDEKGRLLSEVVTETTEQDDTELTTVTYCTGENCGAEPEKSEEELDCQPLAELIESWVAEGDEDKSEQETPEEESPVSIDLSLDPTCITKKVTGFVAGALAVALLRKLLRS